MAWYTRGFTWEDIQSQYRYEGISPISFNIVRDHVNEEPNFNLFLDVLADNNIPFYLSDTSGGLLGIVYEHYVSFSSLSSVGLNTAEIRPGRDDGTGIRPLAFSLKKGSIPGHYALLSHWGVPVVVQFFEGSGNSVVITTINNADNVSNPVYYPTMQWTGDVATMRITATISNPNGIRVDSIVGQQKAPQGTWIDLVSMNLTPGTTQAIFTIHPIGKGFNIVSWPDVLGAALSTYFSPYTGVDAFLPQYTTLRRDNASELRLFYGPTICQTIDSLYSNSKCELLYPIGSALPEVVDKYKQVCASSHDPRCLCASDTPDAIRYRRELAISRYTKRFDELISTVKSDAETAAQKLPTYSSQLQSITEYQISVLERQKQQVIEDIKKSPQCWLEECVSGQTSDGTRVQVNTPCTGGDISLSINNCLQFRGNVNISGYAANSDFSQACHIGESNTIKAKVDADLNKVTLAIANINGKINASIDTIVTDIRDFIDNIDRNAIMPINNRISTIDIERGHLYTDMKDIGSKLSTSVRDISSYLSDTYLLPLDKAIRTIEDDIIANELATDSLMRESDATSLAISDIDSKIDIPSIIDLTIVELNNNIEKNIQKANIEKLKLDQIDNSINSNYDQIDSLILSVGKELQLSLSEKIASAISQYDRIRSNLYAKIASLSTQIDSDIRNNTEQYGNYVRRMSTLVSDEISQDLLMLDLSLAQEKENLSQLDSLIGNANLLISGYQSVIDRSITEINLGTYPIALRRSDLDILLQLERGSQYLLDSRLRSTINDSMDILIGIVNILTDNIAQTDTNLLAINNAIQVQRDIVHDINTQIISDINQLVLSPFDSELDLLSRQIDNINMAVSLMRGPTSSEQIQNNTDEILSGLDIIDSQLQMTMTEINTKISSILSQIGNLRELEASLVQPDTTQEQIDNILNSISGAVGISPAEIDLVNRWILELRIAAEQILLQMIDIDLASIDYAAISLVPDMNSNLIYDKIQNLTTKYQEDRVKFEQLRTSRIEAIRKIMKGNAQSYIDSIPVLPNYQSLVPNPVIASGKGCNTVDALADPACKDRLDLGKICSISNTQLIPSDLLSVWKSTCTPQSTTNNTVFIVIGIVVVLIVIGVVIFLILRNRRK